jgi:hypothetical protein
LPNPKSSKPRTFAVRVFAAAGALVFLLSPSALAVEDRPRVGLVLEGGGALGFAHIAVLEWLEEHHIPIELHCRMSMGGLVGGMYATAKSPAEIQAIVDSIDWGATIDEEWRRYSEARASRRKTATPPPQFLTMEGTSPEKEKAVASRLFQFVGKPIDPPELEAALTQLSGGGYFSRLSYSLVQKDRDTGLRIRAEEKIYGPPFLNVGVTIDGKDVNNMGFGMAGRLTFLNVGTLRSEWRTDAFFGTNNGIISEYYRPFSIPVSGSWLPGLFDPNRVPYIQLVRSPRAIFSIAKRRRV